MHCAAVQCSGGPWHSSQFFGRGQQSTAFMQITNTLYTCTGPLTKETRSAQVYICLLKLSIFYIFFIIFSGVKNMEEKKFKALYGCVLKKHLEDHSISLFDFWFSFGDSITKCQYHIIFIHCNFNLKQKFDITLNKCFSIYFGWRTNRKRICLVFFI